MRLLFLRLCSAIDRSFTGACIGFLSLLASILVLEIIGRFLIWLVGRFR